jgi:hypothetical protein
VSMEYERAVGGAAAAGADGAAPPVAAAQPQRLMSFGTVTLKLTDPKTGAERDANVAEMLLVRGLASVARHRMCASWAVAGYTRCQDLIVLVAAICILLSNVRCWTSVVPCQHLSIPCKRAGRRSQMVVWYVWDPLQARPAPIHPLSEGRCI